MKGLSEDCVLKMGHTQAAGASRGKTTGKLLELRDSQRVALERLTEPGRHFAALWAEPRSGKTAVALKWIEHVKPRVAVVVGPKIAEATWRSEAAKWLDIPYSFHPLTAGNEYPTPTLFRRVAVMFVNYDQFGKSPWKRLRPFLQQMSKLCDGQGMMLLDESHMIKTPSSVQGRNIRPLAAHWHYRLLMTGTPVTNPDQIDAVYGQWTFLNPAIRQHWPTAKDFREHFGEWTTVKGFPELVRPRHQAQLNAYIQSDVITMVGPGEPVIPRKVVYLPPQDVLDAHRDMLKKGVVSFKDRAYVNDPKLERTDTRVAVGLNPLTRLLRMRMIVAGWIKDEDDKSFTITDAARARLKALHKTLSRCSGKVIIACTHLHEISMVKRSLARRNIPTAIITGATRNKDAVIEQFQRDPDLKVLLVQPRTVAMAVDISVANDLIWHTSDFNYVTFKQTSDRIKLSPANPKVWFLCAAGTVDEDVWTTLQEDHDHLRRVVRRVNQSNTSGARARQRKRRSQKYGLRNSSA